MATFTFRKPEHLCKQKEIETLFSAGSQSFSAYPLRATFRRVQTAPGPAVKVLLSVAKRRLHHAIDRNRAKRQLREAYRLNKHLLTSQMPENCTLHIAFIWLAEKPIRTAKVMERMQTVLLRIADTLHNHPNNEVATDTSETEVGNQPAIGDSNTPDTVNNTPDAENNTPGTKNDAPDENHAHPTAETAAKP